MQLDSFRLVLLTPSFLIEQYRKVVAGWIMDVGEYFSLHPTTTHSAVAYLDRLHLSGFSRHEWQMLAISCILIAGTFILLSSETSFAFVLFSSTPSAQHAVHIYPTH